MKKTLYLSFIFISITLTLHAQIRLDGFNKSNINEDLLTGRWKAKWISVPGEPENSYGIYHFRKSFDLDNIPDNFIIHVTADNRYKLYVNGQLLSLGPARGDIYNWNYETVDIAEYLKTGKNVVGAVVWNFADKKPAAQISMNRTGFLLQGNTETEEILNTNDSWLYIKNDAYSPWQKPVLGYYVAGPGELFNSAVYPWGWERADYNDSGWKRASNIMDGAAKGARDYPGWLLVPSPIPPMEYKTERFSSVRICEGAKYPKNFLEERVEFTIPANTKVKLLLDNKKLTTGYLTMLFGKGKNAEIEIKYAEALYEDNTEATTKSYSLNPKRHRDEIEGKRVIGYEDKIIADGGINRSYTTLWWRTWRYVELEIKTASEPLVLEDIYGTFSGYPFVPEFEFSAPSNPNLNKMLDIGWLTARLCANETYMDCPYYEQLQYFGDTRIQAMITMFNTSDRYMVKNALEQGRQSIVADGITMSRYPSSIHQFISSFSLWWICMGYDYWMYRGDEEYLKTLLPAHRGVLSWYEQWLKPDYSLDYVPHWFFADWSAGFPSGEPVREKEGNSSFQDLLYIITLDAAAKMEESFGMPGIADHYKYISQKVRSGFYNKYWDSQRGLFADTHDHRSFSQHVNSLAILAGIVEGEEARQVMEKTLTDEDLIQSTIYFRYYVHQALAKAGMGNMYLDNLQIWRDQMALGLTTWAEMPEPSRSDCHAWGSSPNIELYRILLGIDSDAPGFKKIKVNPSLNGLTEVSGTMPHPHGLVSAHYKMNKKGRLTAKLTLPEGTTGTFIWKGKEYELKSGEQEYIID